MPRCLLILRIRLELNLTRQIEENKGWHHNISKAVCTKKSVDLNIKLEADKYRKTTIHLYAAKAGKGRNDKESEDLGVRCAF